MQKDLFCKPRYHITNTKAVLKYSRKRLWSTFLFLSFTILLLFVCMNLYAINVHAAAPPLEVTGQVTDSVGNPLAAVTITLQKNKKIGTTTDQNGRYVLDIPDENISNAVLVFSTLGFKAKEVPVNGRTKINVRLTKSTTLLGETVITAFGQKKKKEDVVGAITTINPEALKIPSSNLTTALAGRAAGLIGFQRSGEPGADNANFFVRGVTTFGYKVDPLILIDNVEASTTDLARLQVDDIASFSILKDATATAVYGARGANGVLLITTKEGKREKLNVSLRVENSISMPTKKIQTADAVTYMKLANDAALGRDPLAIIPYPLSKIANTDPNHSTLDYPAIDWRDELLKDYTMNQRVNLSVRGGGSIAQYYVSGAFNQDHGVLEVPQVANFNNNINLKSYSLRSNININLTKSTKLKVKLQGSFDDYNGPIDGGAKVYHDIMRTPPTYFQPFYPKGRKYSYLNHIMFGNFNEGNYLNPYADMVKGYKQYSRSKMQAQFEVDQDFDFVTPGLSFTLRATASRYAFFSITRQYNPFYYQYLGKDDQGQNIFRPFNSDEKGGPDNEMGTEYIHLGTGGRDLNSVFFMQGIVNYERQIGESDLSGMLVGMMRSELDGVVGDLQNSLPHRNMNLAGRFTYSYKDRYDLEFNFGYNGSERFSKDHRFGFFPSIGVAWSVSKEDFWQSLKPVFSNFRIRATYGLVGNDAIGRPDQRFFYLSNIDMNSAAYGYSFGPERDEYLNGIAVDRYSNRDITWETAYKTDIAVEMGFFDDHLEIEADYFNQTRKNIFMRRADFPQSMGVEPVVYANVGRAKGSGIDMSINYTKSFYSGLWVKGLANFTYATSKFLRYEEPQYSYPWLYKVGYPIKITRGYIAERLFIDDKEVYNSPEQEFGGIVRGGDIKYVDVNNDGKVTSLDKVPIGYPTVPEINYGFGISLGYKGFDFSIFLEGLARESFSISPTATAPFRRFVYLHEDMAGKTIQNQVLQVYAQDHWSEENRDIYALYPRMSWIDGNPNNEVPSTWWLRNGEFMRVKQLEVGYTFANTEGRFLNRIGIEKLRIYVNGLNLGTISKFKLWDVEMGSNGLAYPIQRVFNMGIKLDF